MLRDVPRGFGWLLAVGWFASHFSPLILSAESAAVFRCPDSVEHIIISQHHFCTSSASSRRVLYCDTKSVAVSGFVCAFHIAVSTPPTLLPSLTLLLEKRQPHSAQQELHGDRVHPHISTSIATDFLPYRFPRARCAYTFTMDATLAQAVANRKPVPEIDFTLHTMEDGSQVSTQERVCKGAPVKHLRPAIY